VHYNYILFIKNTEQMKQLIFTLLVGFFSTAMLFGQSPTVVYSQNKCHWDRLGDLNKMMTDDGAPVLNQLVEDGKLLSWGVLQHSWGDEWNWNMYYVAKDVPTFLDAFSSYISGLGERNAESLESFWDMCYEHKDAIYHEPVGYGSTGSGPKVKSMTMFNLPDGVTAEALSESIDDMNKTVAKIGFPGNGYQFYVVKDEEVTEQQCLVEGTWNSQKVYDTIHNHEAYEKTSEKYNDMWEKVMADRMYRRYYIYE
jgi:hypothetical protein